MNKINMVICTFLAAGIMPLIAENEPAQQEPLTLEHALTLADRQAPQIQIANQQVYIARGQITEVRAAALPQIGVKLHYTRLDDIPTMQFGDTPITMGRRNNYDAIAEVQQLLYAGGGVRAAQELAREYEAAARAQVEQIRIRTAYQVHQAFYHVLRAQAHVNVAQEAYQLAQRNHEIVAHKEAQGISTPFDRVRAESLRSQRHAESIAAQNLKQNAYLALYRILNLPLDTNRQITGDLHIDLPAMAEGDLLALARKHRPDLAAARYAIAIEREATKIARSGAKPTVAAFGRYQQSNPNTAFEDEWEDEWMIGIRAEIPIFQGGRTHGKVNQAQASLQQAQLRYEDLQAQTKLEIAQARTDLVTAERLREAEAAFVAESREALRLATRAYEEGLQEQIDVLSAQVALADSQRRLADAAYNRMMAFRALELATGTLLQHQK